MRTCLWGSFQTEGGFGVPWVVGLAPLGFGFTLMFKSHGFLGLEMCHGLQVWPSVVLGFPVFHSKLPISTQNKLYAEFS